MGKKVQIWEDNPGGNTQHFLQNILRLYKVKYNLCRSTDYPCATEQAKLTQSTCFYLTDKTFDAFYYFITFYFYYY